MPIRNVSHTSHTSHHVRTGNFSHAPSIEQALRGHHSLKQGQAGPAVNQLQAALNAAGANPPLATDGLFGKNTEKALKAFQRQNHLTVDGKAGPQTLRAFDRVKDHYVNPTGKSNHNPLDILNSHKSNASVSKPHSNRVVNTRRGLHNGNPANHSATFDKVYNKGQRNQRVDGRITVNGHTYKFRSGGGGRGNLPAGDYVVRHHIDRAGSKRLRDKPTMQVGGEGYTFRLSNKYDPRVHGTRTLLRIHPDGGGPGTIGCMGIVGDASVQRRFRQDMLADLRKNGGSFHLRVGM